MESEIKTVVAREGEWGIWRAGVELFPFGENQSQSQEEFVISTK